MKELLDKLTTYNLFNYLFPGLVFAVLATEMTSYNLVHSNVAVSFFIFYFFGLVISRIGSVILEPLLRFTSCVKFSPYEDFVKASRLDPQITELSEVNNVYRTVFSMLVTLVALKLYEILVSEFVISRPVELLIGVAFLSALFLAAYRKQTNYITKRVSVALKDDD